jgi:hypothetical protein
LGYRPIIILNMKCTCMLQYSILRLLSKEINSFT